MHAIISFSWNKKYKIFLVSALVCELNFSSLVVHFDESIFIVGGVAAIKA